MNREYLKTLGLDDAAIDAIMAKHGSVVNKTKDDLGAAVTERDDLRTQLTERDEQLEALKKVDPEALQAEIERLKAENAETAETATEYQGKLAVQQKEFAIESALREAKARDPKLAKSALDLERIIVKDGKLSGLEEQLTALKESHEYLFEVEEAADPKNPSFSPGQHSRETGADGVNPFSKDSFNLTEQTRLFREDPERYKQFKAQAK